MAQTIDLKTTTLVVNPTKNVNFKNFMEGGKKNVSFANKEYANIAKTTVLVGQSLKKLNVNVRDMKKLLIEEKTFRKQQLARELRKDRESKLESRRSSSPGVKGAVGAAAGASKSLIEKLLAPLTGIGNIFAGIIGYKALQKLFNSNIVSKSVEGLVNMVRAITTAMGKVPDGLGSKVGNALSKLFTFFGNFIGGSIGRSLEGLDKILNADGSFKFSLDGIFKLVTGLGGLALTFRYLKNPTRIIGDIGYVINFLVRGIAGLAKKIPTNIGGPRSKVTSGSSRVSRGGGRGIIDRLDDVSNRKTGATRFTPGQMLDDARDGVRGARDGVRGAYRGSRLQMLRAQRSFGRTGLGQFGRQFSAVAKISPKAALAGAIPDLARLTGRGIGNVASGLGTSANAMIPQGLKQFSAVARISPKAAILGTFDDILKSLGKLNASAISKVGTFFKSLPGLVGGLIKNFDIGKLLAQTGKVGLKGVTGGVKGIGALLKGGGGLLKGGAAAAKTGMKGLGGRIPIIGSLLSAGFEYSKSGDIGKAGGAGVGAGLGTAIGAGLGSVIPGAGTVVGGLAGGIIGEFLGKTIGGGITEMFEGFNFGETVFKPVKEAFSSITDAFKPAIDSIMKAFGIGKSGKEGQNGFIVALKNIGKIIGILAKLLLKSVAPIINVIGSVLSKTVGVLAKIISGVVSVVSGVLKFAGDIINRLPDWLPGVKTAKGAVKGLKNFNVSEFLDQTNSALDSSDWSGAGKFRRGGKLFGGKPSGDSIPAFLERGEYVMNRNSVKAIGSQNLDKLNFGMFPRFQSGGSLKGLSAQDYRDLAYIVSGEAQPNTNDEFGVAASILNRVSSPAWPNTIKAVGNQSGQYEAVYTGRARDDKKLAKKLGSVQGQASIVSALKSLKGRTDFKGISQYANMGNGDIKFDRRGNFFHYSNQFGKNDPPPSTLPTEYKKFINPNSGTAVNLATTTASGTGSLASMSENSNSNNGGFSGMGGIFDQIGLSPTAGGTAGGGITMQAGINQATQAIMNLVRPLREQGYSMGQPLPSMVQPTVGSSPEPMLSASGSAGSVSNIAYQIQSFEGNH
jgi:hypothetical protein